MKKLVSFKSLTVILVLIFAVSILFAGCGQEANIADSSNNSSSTESKAGEGNKNEDSKKEESNGKLEGRVTAVGSTSVGPLAQALADAFSEVEPGITVDVQGGGSSTGVKAAHEGAADIGMASRKLKEKEQEWGLTEHRIAMDGIAICVHPSNPISELSKEDAAKIFKGEIKNWKEVGGPDQAIIVINREAGSGTRGAFEEIMDVEDKVREDALIQNGNGGVKAAIASKEDVIGYLSLGYVDDTVKALKIDGVEATVENIKADKYKIARPFLMLTKGEVKPEVKAFLDYIFSAEGQKVVADEGYIPVK